jgi:photosystem I P700 chlorophyll a apoprotein A1
LLVGSTKSAPKLEWFQNVVLNHHLAGLLGLGSLAWAGQIHVSLPINKLLDAGVDLKKFHFHEFLLNPSLMAQLPKF